MGKLQKRTFMITVSIILALIVLAATAILIFINSPQFGQLPKGERLQRVLQSPNYRNGQFRNLQPTEMMSSRNNNRWQAIWHFLTDKKPDGIIPDTPIPAVKNDLKKLPADSDIIVWFGHSSYLLQLSGKRFLVDPVFYKASPVSFINKPFPGTDIYKPEDLPERIDYLIITHDHWDHLDYNTVTELRNRIGKVICPLGVGQHFEYWGFDPSVLIELDWQENATLNHSYNVHCLPARHFSGRGLTANKTLWVSFLLETPSLTVFIGGDSGYGSHYHEIGNKFPNIDLAILENGQYNENWRHIHTMPQELGKEAQELGANTVVTVHHSKYALARHLWDEPLHNELNAAEQYHFNLTVLKIGEITTITPSKQTTADSDPK